MIKQKRQSRKGNWPDRLFRGLLLAVLALFVVILVSSGFKLAARQKVLNQKLSLAQAQLNQLIQDNEQLQGKLSATADPAYIERQAREKFNLQKPGEQVVVILPSEKTDNGPQPASRIETLSLWEKLLEWLGW